MFFVFSEPYRGLIRVFCNSKKIKDRTFLGQAIWFELDNAAQRYRIWRVMYWENIVFDVLSLKVGQKEKKTYRCLIIRITRFKDV